MREASPLIELARRQHGLITTSQARDVGIRKGTLDRLRSNGLLDRFDRGIHRLAAAPVTADQMVMAAVLAGGPGSFASHCTAVRLLGSSCEGETRPEITIPEGGYCRRTWLVAHESGDVDLATIVKIRGIPTSAPARLAVDIGCHVGPFAYDRILRQLQHRHGLSGQRLLAEYLRHSERGRTGCGPLHDWLERYQGAAGWSESALEMQALDVLLDLGFPPPVRQHVVDVGRNIRIDLAYPEAKVAIEVDGPHHGERTQARWDARRTRLLEAQGWTVIRVRSWQWHADLGALVRALRPLLAQAA